MNNAKANVSTPARLFTLKFSDCVGAQRIRRRERRPRGRHRTNIENGPVTGGQTHGPCERALFCWVGHGFRPHAVCQAEPLSYLDLLTPQIYPLSIFEISRIIRRAPEAERNYTVGHSHIGQELAIFEPIWLGNACPKASILRHAGCERATPFTSKTRERANAVAESDQRRHIPRSCRGRLASPSPPPDSGRHPKSCISRRESIHMPTLLPWTSVGIGDLDVFIPSPPCLVVYTSYVDEEPESTVIFFWQEENTGIVHQELLFMEPAPFETALKWAQEHAPTRSVERIHVKHARTKETPKRTARVKHAVKKSAVKTKARVPKQAAAKKPKRRAKKAS